MGLIVKVVGVSLCLVEVLEELGFCAKRTSFKILIGVLVDISPLKIRCGGNGISNAYNRSFIMTATFG